MFPRAKNLAERRVLRAAATAVGGADHRRRKRKQSGAEGARMRNRPEGRLSWGNVVEAARIELFKFPYQKRSDESDFFYYHHCCHTLTRAQNHILVPRLGDWLRS